MVVYLLYFHGIYRVRISGMFLQWMCLRLILGVVVFTEACGLSLQTASVWSVIYTVYPLYRHNAKDRSLGVGRDINTVQYIQINVMYASATSGEVREAD